MNRTDRLLAIVLELQRRQRSHVRADDLAARFEVSRRTIYRDIQALCEAGVPVVAADRRGYALVEGYFLPPVRLTPDEALTLTLGGEVIERSFDAGYRAAARSAARKIAAVLPEDVRAQVDHLRLGLAIAAPRRLPAAQLAMLGELRLAIAQRRQIRIDYARSRPGDDAPDRTVREVDPYRLTRLPDDWYLSGYCHLRAAVRVFRLSRIGQVTVLERTFTPAAADESWEATEVGEPVVVLLLADPHVAQWVRDAHAGDLLAEEPAEEGTRMTLLLPPTPDLERRLLRWGGDVRVLEPSWLHDRLIAHAERMLRSYGAVLADE